MEEGGGNTIDKDSKRNFGDATHNTLNEFYVETQVSKENMNI